MGMYTQLVVTAPLSEKGLEIVRAWEDANWEWRRWWSAQAPKKDAPPAPWDAVREMLPDAPGVREFYADERRGLIGTGSSAHSDVAGQALLGDTWLITCSIKNYDWTIEKFLEGVLPHLLAKPAVALTYYEAADTPDRHLIDPVPGEGTVMYVRWTEHNDHEAETWHHYIPLTNENADGIETLATVAEASRGTYHLDTEPLPEGLVNALVAQGDSGYMARHTKLVGRLDAEWADIDLYYKGGVRKMMVVE